MSATAVWRRLANVPDHTALPADLHAGLGQLVDASGPAWDGVIADFARVIAVLQLLIDTEVFFLHGPLTALGTRFCEAVARQAAVVAPALANAPLNIVPSPLRDDAGALGAASLAMEAWLPAAEKEPRVLQSHA